MDIKGKTKDNGVPCREDVALYCARRELRFKKDRNGGFFIYIRFHIEVAK